MTQILLFNPEDTGLVAPWIDDGSEWWAGVQNGFASIVLAATLSTSCNSAAIAQQSANFHQDDPAGNLSATVDEYFCLEHFGQTQIAIAAQVASSRSAAIAQLTYHQDDPAGHLSATVDEYFCLAQGPAPLVPVFICPQSWAADEQFPALYGQFDEDFCQTTVPPPLPTYVYPPPWAFDEQYPQLTAVVSPICDDSGPANPVIVAQSFFCPPIFDEQYPVLSNVAFDDGDRGEPVRIWPLIWIQPGNFDEQYPQLSAVSAPALDDSTFLNPVIPVPTTFVVPQSWSFDEQFPVLVAPVLDDGAWINAGAWPTVYPQQPALDEQYPQLYAALEDGTYASPLLCAPAAFFCPAAFNEEYPVLSMGFLMDDGSLYATAAPVKFFTSPSLDEHYPQFVIVAGQKFVIWIGEDIA